MIDKPNFHRDYLYRFSNDECHHDFHFWAASSLIGAMLGRRVWVQHGRFTVNPNLYVVLVGIAGSGKDSAREIVEELMHELFPSYLLSSSIQSREDIASQMASPEGLRTYICKNTGVGLEYRPFYLLISEMAGFFSVDCAKMIAMLVEMFGGKHFSTGFKKDRKEKLNQVVHNPCMSMLGCVQPDWFMTNMKLDLFQRGLGRRMIIVYRDKEKLNPYPSYPIDSEEGWKRVVAHVMRLHKDETQGRVILTKEADEWWFKYYMAKDKNRSDDPIIFQFQETRHIILLKLAVILSFCEYDFKYEIRPEHLAIAEQLLISLEPDIRRLTGGIGTNPMASVIQLMLEYIKSNNGMVRERKLYSVFWKDCPKGDMDYASGLLALENQKLIVKALIPNADKSAELMWIFTPDKWWEYSKK